MPPRTSTGGRIGRVAAIGDIDGVVAADTEIVEVIAGGLVEALLLAPVVGPVTETQ